jgi:predicted acetyltransferase
LGAGVAEINLVSTIPQQRKKGFGASITLSILTGAYKMGYRLGILESLPFGENVYKKLGFKEYSRVEIYEQNV